MSSDIPVISITQECCSDDENTATDDLAKLNIAEALTDTEDLIMEQDTVRFRNTKGGGSPVLATGALLVQPPTTNGSVTDVEDCTDSEDDDEGDVKSAREADITLDSFLDQGFVDEVTNTNNKGDKPKALTRCFSKATESDSLQVFVDTSNALTDCEDCALSDDDDSLGHVSIPDCPEDILMKGVDDGEAVDIHNSMKRKQEKHSHKQDAVDDSSSESDNDSKVRHKRSHRKSEDRSKSDCENFSMSDEESAGACARPSNRQSALFEAEEVTMEGSDGEEEKPLTFPEINITFVSEEPSTPLQETIKKRPSQLAVQTPNADEALTDVENLDSSDSEDEKETKVRRLMPRAVVQQGRSSGGGTTDVEDFNDSDENEQPEPEQKIEIGQEFLPSPVREIAIMKHGESGEERQNVMPLNQGMLTVKTPDIEQALTDVEDMSDNEDEGEMYDSSKYTIESLPDTEMGDVYSSDSTCVKGAAKLDVTSPTREPVTDTEDLFFERSTSNSGSGSELRRRRKPKQCHSQSVSNNVGAGQQFKGKKFLEMKSENTGTATTDVEDMYLSDEAQDCGFTRSQQQRRATIQLMVNANECEAKTDVEFLSGDELPHERTTFSPQLCYEGYSSVVKAREHSGPKDAGALDVRQIPMIRKISPSPDTHNCNTDCEDIQICSDEEEDGCYERAQTATPYELTRALEESGTCEIHESSTRLKSELLDVKGGDQQEMHTDVEFLEDEAGNVAE